MTLVLAVLLALVIGSAIPAADAAPALVGGTAAVCTGSSVGPGIPPPATLPAGIPGFHAAWYGQSGYPTLCPGERSSAVVAYYNSGSRGWVRGRLGETAYLGTWDADPGQDEPTSLGGDGLMGSPATGWPRWNRVAQQPHDYVGPGQVVWFQFTIQAPQQPGFYRLYIRPLVEAATWMEDVGVYWQVTVLNADGSAPAGRISSRVGAPIRYDALALAAATHEGTSVASGASCPPASASACIVLASGTRGTWTSTWSEAGFPFSQLIPSWNADTPPGTWIEIEMQARTGELRETRWWRMGTWAYGDETIRRTSVNGQTDTDGVVDTDTFKTRAEKMSAYRMRVTLARAAGVTATPSVRRIGAVVSDTRSYLPRYPSPRYVERAMELDVPRYSQEIHAGQFPEYDGGGEAWCSPTSTAMVVAYWGRRPSPAELAWVVPYSDPQVDYAARYTYDSAYGGTGNWPFNAAYAARFGLDTYVHQLRSLNEAERYIAAGVPLVASITHAPGALPGFLGNAGTAGHLLVIVGFAASGDVIANDPAALGNSTVRRVYPRAAFERSWIGGSGGVVYVIAPANTILP